MARVIERDVRFDIGGDRQRIHAIDTDVRNVTFKHILLPVWMAAYKYRGRDLSVRRERTHRAAFRESAPGPRSRSRLQWFWACWWQLLLAT